MSNNLRTAAAAEAAAMRAANIGPDLATLRTARDARTIKPSDLALLEGIEGAMAGRRRQAKEAAMAAADLAADMGHGPTAQREAARRAALPILANGADEDSKAYEMAAMAAEALAERTTDGLAAVTRKGRDRMTGGDVLSLCRQAVREAVQAGSKAALSHLPAAERTDRLASLASDLAIDMLGDANMGNGRLPMWAEAPDITAAERADLAGGRAGYRAAWLVTLKRSAWRILKAEQRAALAATEALGTAEARADLMRGTAAAKMAAAEAEAAALAARLNLSTAEADAVALAITDATRAEIAAARNVTPDAVKKAAQRGRKALGLRWPNRAALADALAAAQRTALAEANALAAEQTPAALVRVAEAAAREAVGQSPRARGLAVVRYLDLAERSSAIWAATTWHQDTGRIMAARPPRRPTYRYRPTNLTADLATLRAMAERRAEAERPGRSRGLAVLRYLDMAEAVAEHRTAAARYRRAIGYRAAQTTAAARWAAAAAPLDLTEAEALPGRQTARQAAERTPSGLALDLALTAAAPHILAAADHAADMDAHRAAYGIAEWEAEQTAARQRQAAQTAEALADLAEADRQAAEAARARRTALAERTAEYQRTVLAPVLSRAQRKALQAEAEGDRIGRGSKADRLAAAAI